MRNKTALLATAGALLALSGSAAFAGTPPHVDQSKPTAVIYPVESQQRGEVGVVAVSVHVRSNGQPDSPAIAHSSGYSDLDDAAINTVMNWHFVPAVHDGDTVSDWATVQVVYQLSQSPALTPPAK
jgi:TonB family protein